MRVAHAHVVEVKKVRSQGVARIIAEIPIEEYQAAVALLDDKDVLVSLASLAGAKYGILSGEHEEKQEIKPPPPGSTLAGLLHARGYFRNPHLWAALDKAGIYTQAEHKRAVEAMPCSLANTREACSGDIVMHHCRTAENAGTGIKPPHYYGIPLCCAHHERVHRDMTRDMRDKLLGVAIGIAADGAKAAIKRALGLESLSGITHDELVEFERSVNFSGMAGLWGA